jgi:hypothetical protein
MYHFIRRIHLFTGLLLLVFVVMYFASGYIMIHATWFGGREPKVSVRSETLDLPANESDAELANRLQAIFGLRGQSGAPEHRKDGSVRINYARPGTTFQAVINSGGKQITITRRDFGFAGVANGLHRLRGYHGGWAYWTWSLMYDSASLSLIVFGISGVILWYQSSARRLAGWICLAASFGFTAAMIVYLMWTK